MRHDEYYLVLNLARLHEIRPLLESVYECEQFTAEHSRAIWVQVSDAIDRHNRAINVDDEEYET